MVPEDVVHVLARGAQAAPREGSSTHRAMHCLKSPAVPSAKMSVHTSVTTSEKAAGTSDTAKRYVAPCRAAAALSGAGQGRGGVGASPELHTAHGRVQDRVCASHCGRHAAKPAEATSGDDGGEVTEETSPRELFPPKERV